MCHCPNNSSTRKAFTCVMEKQLFQWKPSEISFVLLERSFLPESAKSCILDFRGFCGICQFWRDEHAHAL